MSPVNTTKVCMGFTKTEICREIILEWAEVIRGMGRVVKGPLELQGANLNRNTTHSTSITKHGNMM